MVSNARGKQKMWDVLLNTLTSKTITSILPLWDADPQLFTLVSQGINAVYRFQSQSNVLYLRVTHEKLRKFTELEAALSFQYYLSSASVPVCKLVKSVNGRFIEKIQQDEHTFLAHAVHEVPGTPIHFDYPNLELYEYWGRMLGEMHKESISYDATDFTYPSWEGEVDELNKYIQDEPRFIKKVLVEVSQFINQYPIHQYNFGLIHGDHRKGNVLSDGHTVNFIDFDLPRFFWFMDDITRPFFSAVMQKHTNWQDKLSPYITGYRSAFQLEKSELENFVWFIRLKALNMYLWTKYNWSSDVAPGGISTKEWLSLLYRMIEDQSWESELNHLVGLQMMN